MMAANINFSPVRVTFCPDVPRMTAMMIPANNTTPSINKKKTPTPKRWLCMPSILRSSRVPGPASARALIQALPFDLRILLVVVVDEQAVNERTNERDADGHQECQRTIVKINHFATLQFKSRRASMLIAVPGLPASGGQTLDDEKHAHEKRRQIEYIDGIALVPPRLLADARPIGPVVALEVGDHHLVAHHRVILQIDSPSLQRLDLRRDEPQVIHGLRMADELRFVAPLVHGDDQVQGFLVVL